MKLRIFFLTLLFSFSGVFSPLKAQTNEFNCMVQIATPGMSETERNIMQTLQSAIYEFMNGRRWSNYNFKPEERIEASILITVNNKIGADEYSGSIQVQARRPVFQTSYSSTILNHNDRDFQFRYVEHQPLDYADNMFTSNLTSVLAYYAYVILGFDFDTFSPLGGTAFFEKAQAVINQSQSAPEKGWKSFEGQRNRYWLIENLFNPTYRSIREGYYTYHRRGFDAMPENIELGRSEVTRALELFQKAHRERPGSFLLQLILTAKSDELISLYTDAPQMDKTKVINILNELDPSNAAKYRRINQPSTGSNPAMPGSGTTSPRPTGTR